ncbi:hypothetical protein [Streptomyces sp. JHA26]|uniref:hypothetical protein n=1 Tax=Streptomyces sp. JHA26 TaxID=1917143 RepID=UPI00098B016A|nr:hypothetical protein [Streptomyces sp. JHA26]
MTDVFTTASSQSDAADQVALAGTNARSGDTCRPVDRVTPVLIREGWNSAPEKTTWRNGASTQQQHQFTFTQTYSARGMLTGRPPIPRCRPRAPAAARG